MESETKREREREREGDMEWRIETARQVRQTFRH